MRSGSNQWRCNEDCLSSLFSNARYWVLLTHVRSGWRPYEYTSVDRVHQVVGELILTQPKTRLAWRTRTSLRIPSYTPTRWWSKFEVMHHIHDCFEDVNTFLHDGSLELPVTTTRKMLEILDDEPRCRKLKIEQLLSTGWSHSLRQRTSWRVMVH